MLEADIQQLRTLSVELDDVATQIDAIDVRSQGDQIGVALPGVALGQVCAQAGASTEGAWLRVAQRVQQLSRIVKDSAEAYQITDEEFQRRLNTMDFRTRG